MLYMPYGDATDVQELVWGKARSVVPNVVTTALEAATDMINDELNIRVELTGNDLPAKFKTIANLLAAGIMQESRGTGEVKVTNTIRGEKLLKGYKDEATEDSSGEQFRLQFLDNE